MEVMGLPLVIEWAKFKPGTSFFIPCVDRKAVERFVKSEVVRHHLSVVCKQVVENGVYGLRVWRIDATVPPHSPPV